MGLVCRSVQTYFELWGHKGSRRSKGGIMRDSFL